MVGRDKKATFERSILQAAHLRFDIKHAKWASLFELVVSFYTDQPETSYDLAQYPPAPEETVKQYLDRIIGPEPHDTAIGRSAVVLELRRRAFTRRLGDLECPNWPGPEQET